MQTNTQAYRFDLAVAPRAERSSRSDVRPGTVCLTVTQAKEERHAQSQRRLALRAFEREHLAALDAAAAVGWDRVKTAVVS
jgi:hypothetical protein